MLGDHMNIGIIGGGAVGLLFGVYLSKEHTVTIFTRTKSQECLLNEKGIDLEIGNATENFSIKATTNEKDLHHQQFIIVTVKQYHLDSTEHTLLSIPKEIPLLFIQNGMSHLSFIEGLPHHTVYLGTVEHGVTRLDRNKIKHTGVGTTNIALYRGKAIGELNFPTLHQENFPFEIQDDPLAMLHTKLVANAVINPLTAILNIKNGSLIENPFYYSLFHQLHSEVVSVFPRLNKEKSLHNIVSICKKTSNNLSSMNKDIQLGRRTEIDAILGYILQKGKEQGLPLPKVEILYQMVKGLERERGIGVE